MRISQISFTLLIFLTLGAITTCSLPHQKSKYYCEVQRAALDIGSGSTKLLAAKVDKCRKKIVRVVKESSFAIKFKESLHLHNGVLPEEIYSEVKERLIQIKSELSKSGFLLSGVATEVFRQAKNGKTFITRLSKETGIPIRLIDQKKEAHLGFWGAVAVTGKDPNKILVWDIGGGSMQMTTQRKETLFTYLGKLASVSFKIKILSYQKKKRGSPNPIGQYGTLWAADLAEREAKKVDYILKSDAKIKEVIGIGGVHYFSVRNQLQINPGTPYSTFQIEDVIKERQNWSDRQLFGSYKETEVSNLILVKSFMKALNFNTVLSAKVNLATGVLFDESLW